jgi:hypothetical protein
MTDHVCFDVSIGTAKTSMDFLKDKRKYFCWNLLMSVPLEGDGTYNNTANTLANGDVTMKVNLRNCVNLLTQWTKVSTKRCQQFAQWFNGGNMVKPDDKFKSNPKLRRVIALNCNDAANKGLVHHHKVQPRIINQLIFHVLTNHLATSSYKSFLANKPKFLFIDKKSGNKWHSGLILMQQMLNFYKPETIVKVCHLKKELDTIVLWPTHKNNMLLLTTRMMTILQEIHAKTSKHSYTDQRFITNLFRTIESSPTKKFLSFVDQLKS